MPELPEVETICRGIQPLIKQRFREVIIRHPSLRWPIPTDLPSILPDQQVISITRRAKYLLIDTTAGTLIIHLGMSGRLYLHDQLPRAEKHDHVDFLFNQYALRYTDPRRFGAILLTHAWQQHPLFCQLGPEPLVKDFNANYLLAKSRGKKVAIKNFIMNSHIVVGVGNIYANEALFLAGIHPLKPTGEISAQQAKLLCTSIKSVLRKAIQAGGTTLKDFKNSNGKPGYFKQSLSTYGRADEPCILCDTILEKRVIGQRASVYCPQCQKL